MRISSLPAVFVAALLCASAQAEIHEVKMLNRGAGGALVYEPDYLKIAPGDTVRFLPTQSGHNAASLPAMLPAGAQGFMGKINQQTEQTFTVPGLYGVQCMPHLAMGMVMLIQVGEPNGQAPSLPPTLPNRAIERFNTLLQREQSSK
jgi:pseudoazurin